MNTLVTTTSVFHADTPGASRMPRRRFGHRLDWFERCSLCALMMLEASLAWSDEQETLVREDDRAG